MIKMGISKYNIGERQVAREIYRLNGKLLELRAKWISTDMEINILKSKLNGKYGRDKKY